MSKNSGYVVTFTDSEGNQQRGHVYHKSQYKALQDINKLAVNVTDENGNHQKHAGRDVVKMMDKSRVKQIGFID